MMQELLVEFKIENLKEYFSSLKEIYNYNQEEEENLIYIRTLVNEYGYLPYPHIKALEELSPAQVIAGIEEKLKINNIFDGESFNFQDLSPARRAGFENADWIKTDQHNVKLINLAGLGNGNISETPGRFIDWLTQLLIMPCGNLDKKVLATTMYFIPFHPREFGCAYLPTSSEVSQALVDEKITSSLNIDSKGQIKLYFALCQLCGHPIMYDVLPQTGRFSKIVLSNPYVARWFDIKFAINEVKNKVEELLSDFEDENHKNKVRSYFIDNLEGRLVEVYEEIEKTVELVDEKLLEFKKELSDKICAKDNQVELYERAKSIINTKLGVELERKLTEDDIHNQGEIIGELISQGMWPSPGGAWNSCGVPVFDKMSEGAGYPIFKHFNVDDEDVSEFANLDCQTPYYFTYLENGTFNQRVIDFYIDYMLNLQAEYNFDGFRVDHIDHIADKVSEDENQTPISYRAPRKVLGQTNSAIKAKVPYFATLAEYMLWDDLLEEYHIDMNFDILWGNDIVSQMEKTPDGIIEDLEYLAKHNEDKKNRLSILKTYNNQDGEFEAIDQYPGQLGEAGAIFKWFKFKFLQNGENSQRPCLIVDGDESFTKTGIEGVINSEVSMKREKNYEFFAKFDAINRLALNSDITRYGKASLLEAQEDGFTSWIVEHNNEALLVVANANNPTERLNKELEDGSTEKYIKEGEPIENKEIEIPQGYQLTQELILPDGEIEFSSIDINQQIQKLEYEKLEPAEFRLYKLEK